MDDSQWTSVSPPTSPRVRDGLALLKRQLPGRLPYRAWSGFQFLPLKGGFLEVDALVATPAGVFLVGVETFGGRLELRGGTWRHTRQNGEVDLHESPLRELRHAAEALREVLDRHVERARAPRVQPLVFLTEPDVEIDGDDGDLRSVAFHPDHSRSPSVLEALQDAAAPGLSPPPEPLDVAVVDRTEEALEEAGYVGADRTVRVGPWELGELLYSGPKYDEYLADHTRDERDETCRARVFWAPRGAGDEALARLQEAARREASLLSELSHRSILAFRDHVAHETRPAILFDHPEGARRLDRVVEAGELPPPRRRLEILENIADAVRYAHGRKVVHRALNPHSVLLVDGGPELRVFNWHTSRRAEHETGTRHVSDYLEESAACFLAPELLQRPMVEETADVFGLGALGYYLFAEEPPAGSISGFVSRLREDGGLKLDAAPSPGVSPKLHDLIFEATHPEPDQRLGSVEEFLDRLESYWGDEPSVSGGSTDPVAARPGDRVGRRWRVEERLGTGSTATALRAVDDRGREVVLKVANDESAASYLDDEADALEQVDSDHVVSLHERTTIDGRRTLVMDDAGQSLRRELRERTALSLDEQRRFGLDLAETVADLEASGVYHRDIKPSNLGVGQVEKKGQTSLLLFDFSLRGVDVERTRAGTDAYRDPFVQGRGQWDYAADRYSAALVLYEMVTQRLPSWGEDDVHPAAAGEAALKIEEDLFPAPVRDDLTAFFRRALAREVDQRFESGQQMANAWEGIYETTVHAPSDPMELDGVEPSTDVGDLPLSPAARDALDSLGITEAESFVETSTAKFHFQRGSGREVRSELLELHDRLSELFPRLTDEASESDRQRADQDFSSYGVDQILDGLIEKPADFDVDLEMVDGGFARLVRVLLGVEEEAAALPWRPWRALVDQLRRVLGFAPDRAARAAEQVRRAWPRKQMLRPLREDLVDVVDSQHGVATDEEVANGLLGRRGAREIHESNRRGRVAAAVGRAALEAERAVDAPEVSVRRLSRGDAVDSGRAPLFVATRDELLDILEPLADCAEQLVRSTNVPSPDGASERLATVADSAGVRRVPPRRLLTLAAAASDGAALSSHDELYPVGMAAERAIRLTASVLRRRASADPLGLSPEAVREAVADRFPRAEALPEGSDLEQVVQRAGLALEWSPGAHEGHGAYVPTYESRSPALSAVTGWQSSESSTGSGHGASKSQVEVSKLEKQGGKTGFFAVIAKEHRLEWAAEVLAEAFDLTVVSVERILVEEARRAAESRGVPWETVLRADGMDWRETDKLRHQLESRVFGTGDGEESVAWRLRERFKSLDADRILLVRNGLLGRWEPLLRWDYDGEQLQPIQWLRDRTNQSGPETVWMLVPPDPSTDKPMLGGVPLPVDTGEYLRPGSAALKAL